VPSGGALSERGQAYGLVGRNHLPPQKISEMNRLAHLSGRAEKG